MDVFLADPSMLALASGVGVLVGFVLGLVGGGGSILAVPLLLYVVGVASLVVHKQCAISPV